MNAQDHIEYEIEVEKRYERREMSFIVVASIGFAAGFIVGLLSFVSARV